MVLALGWRDGASCALRLPDALRGRDTRQLGPGDCGPYCARTARDVCPHSTIWQYGRGKPNGCLPPCRLPPRPTRGVVPTRRRKPSLLEAGGSASKDAEFVHQYAFRYRSALFPVVVRPFFLPRESVSFAPKTVASVFKSTPIYGGPVRGVTAVQDAGIGPGVVARIQRVHVRVFPAKRSMSKPSSVLPLRFGLRSGRFLRRFLLVGSGRNQGATCDAVKRFLGV